MENQTPITMLSSPLDGDADDFCEDASSWCDQDDEADGVSELDRDWQKRREGFYNSGYRDGIAAGQNASAQQGFNQGFQDSVLVGYKWGLARGVTSALAVLPDQLKEKMIPTVKKQMEFQELGESVRLISTEDALKLFHEDFRSKKLESQSGNEGIQNNRGYDCDLVNHFAKLQFLLFECPAISVGLGTEKQTIP